MRKRTPVTLLGLLLGVLAWQLFGSLATRGHHLARAEDPAQNPDAVEQVEQRPIRIAKLDPDQAKDSIATAAATHVADSAREKTSNVHTRNAFNSSQETQVPLSKPAAAKHNMANGLEFTDSAVVSGFRNKVGNAIVVGDVPKRGSVYSIQGFNLRFDSITRIDLDSVVNHALITKGNLSDKVVDFLSYNPSVYWGTARLGTTSETVQVGLSSIHLRCRTRTLIS